MEDTIKRRYYTVGQVSRKFAISNGLVRHYDDIFNLKISRNRAGRRIFTEKDLAKMKHIIRLFRVEGYTTAGAIRKYNLDSKNNLIPLTL